MAKLKLVKGASYNNGIVRADRKHPYVEISNAYLADRMVRSGFFVSVEQDSAETDCDTSAAAQPEIQPDFEALAAMTKAKLVEYCEEQGIDISKCKTKKDMLAVISAHFGGSITICDLEDGTL